MNTGLVLVTHDGIGTVMLEQASRILDHRLDEVQVYEVGADGLGARRAGVTASQHGSLAELLRNADQGAGVLVLTDVPGATPFNQAARALGPAQKMVSGLNLPMLIRVWNYRHEPLDALVRLAVDGGRNAIVESP